MARMLFIVETDGSKWYVSERLLGARRDISTHDTLEEAELTGKALGVAGAAKGMIAQVVVFDPDGTVGASYVYPHERAPSS